MCGDPPDGVARNLQDVERVPDVASDIGSRMVAFGTNEWLVDEIYQQYLKDPQTVDRAWWDFFADYRPGESTSTIPGPAPSAAPPTPTDSSIQSPRPGVAPAGAPGLVAERPAGRDASAPTASITPAGPKVVVPPLGHSLPGSDMEAPASSENRIAPQPSLASIPTIDQDGEIHPRVLRGPAARVVTNMEASLEVPTATSVRALPAKLLIDNRLVINNQLSRGRGGKVSFTHLIGYALIRALAQMPEMNVGFVTVDGKPAVATHQAINLGLAIDLAKPDGTRQLLVPCIKGAEQMDFATFWATYEELVRKARSGGLTADDFVGTTVTLTNPGTIGTVHSVPRLMSGQGLIVGVGSLDYPAEWQGAAPETLARQGVSKILTLTSTYDHRIIQGAQSGDFLRRVHQLLLGEHEFYDEIFTALRIPYEPVRWATDIAVSHDADLNKTARVQELIHAYRVRGHLMADIDPLDYKQRKHPDLDVNQHGLTLWDLDREFAVAGFAGRDFMTLREVLRVLRDAYCRTVGIEYMHMQDPEQRHWIQKRIESPGEARPRRAAAHPAHPQRRRGVRDLPADQVRGPEAVLPRGW